MSTVGCGLSVSAQLGPNVMWRCVQSHPITESGGKLGMQRQSRITTYHAHTSHHIAISSRITFITLYFVSCERKRTMSNEGEKECMDSPKISRPIPSSENPLWVGKMDVTRSIEYFGQYTGLILFKRVEKEQDDTADYCYYYLRSMSPWWLRNRRWTN